MEAISTELKTITVKDFCALKGFTSIARLIRTNKSDYPYITFIDANNVAENVYFSKNGSTLVTEGEPVTKELLAKFSMAETTNAEGEKRWKLTSGEGSRISLEDLF